MNESGVIKFYEPCVGLRKDGRLCRAVGRIFDPDRNGLVCDAHQPGGRGSERLKRAARLLYTHYVPKEPEAETRMAASLADYRERVKTASQQLFHPLPLGLCEDALRIIHKELQKFADGNPLSAKVRKLLESILREDSTRKQEVQKTRKG